MYSKAIKSKHDVLAFFMPKSCPFLQVYNIKEEIKNMEEHVVIKSKSRSTIKRAVAIAAVLTLCIITVAMTPLANSIKGFFKDIVRFDGTIAGTQYENATNDIKVSAMEISTDNYKTVIPLELSFENPNEAPFAHIQEIAVADYMILDSITGEVLKLKSYHGYKDLDQY